MTAEIPESPLQRILEFCRVRREIEDRIRSLELSDFNIRGPNMEAKVRSTLREVEALLKQLIDLVGPPSETPTSVA